MLQHTTISKTELSSLFYEVSYHTESVAFKKNIIISSFQTTCIFSFNGEGIVELAKKNAAEAPEETKAAYVDTMRKSVARDKASPSTEEDTNYTRKGYCATNTLFLP